MKTQTKQDQGLRKPELRGISRHNPYGRIEPEVWIGVIPSIFGYGMSVAATSEAECAEALQREFKRWMAMESNAELGYSHSVFKTFGNAFDYFGGRIDKVKLGAVYYDDFGS